MKNKHFRFLLSIFFVFSILFFSSCYTKKRGVVPCPTWGQIEQDGTLTAEAVK